MSDLNAYKRRLCPFLTLLAAMIWLTTPARGEAGAGPMSQGSDSAAVVPVDEFSPSFLGVYRKVMEIEDEIVTYAAKYKVDVALARAVCMYESGGNPDLTSVAGARGYFQVMPSTFRLMRVPTNIEAGIKYLGQLVRQFGREDYALAAYNGGPTRVGRRAAMPLESLQYVLGVGTYRSVLKMYEPSVRVHVAQLRIDTVQPGEDWWGLSRRLQVPLVQLRFYNPFLAARTLRPGHQVVYPVQPRKGLFDTRNGAPQYRTRLGDNYIKLAYTLGVDLDALRDSNELWRLEPLLPGTLLTIPFGAAGNSVAYRVADGDDLASIAERMRVDPWWIVRDNSLWDDQVRPGMVLNIRALAPPPEYAVHRVRAGENLTSIAERYGTTVGAIQRANSLSGTRIRIGQQLRIPSRS
jgi:hypothetical protein